MFQIAAISEQSSESENDNTDSPNIQGWKSFNIRSVVAASEDLFNFILSEKGRRVRVFLVQDILKAADAFQNEEALCIFYEKQGTGDQSVEVSIIIITINLMHCRVSSIENWGQGPRPRV